MASNRGWDEVTELFFSDGRITIKTPPALMRNNPAVVEVYRAGKTQELSVPQVYWSWAFRRQADAFVSDVLENRPSISAGEDALEDLRLIEEMWRKDPLLAGV
jgi:predicted dehydrogenase